MLKNISLRRRKKHRPSLKEEIPNLTCETEDAPHNRYLYLGYDDTDSISSFSTMATTDDLPGPSRVMKNMYSYFKFGRKLEQAILRYKYRDRTPRVLSNDYIRKALIRRLLVDLDQRSRSMEALSCMRNLMK